MVVVCPHCQQYFEIDDIYFQQGVTVPCPTCQTALVPYQPPSQPPSEPAPEPTPAEPGGAQTVETTVSPAAAEPAAEPSAEAPAGPVFDMGTGTPPPAAVEPPPSAPAWSSGDLLWSGSKPPQEPTVSAESPPAGDARPAEIRAPEPFAAPEPSLPSAPEAPAPQAPPPSPRLDTPAPPRAASSWEEVGRLSWGAPPPMSDNAAPAAAFSSPDVVPPQAPAPGPWGPTQNPGAQLPTAPVAAWTEGDPGLPPPPPPALEPAPNAAVGAASAPEILPEAAPEQPWGSAPSPAEANPLAQTEAPAAEPQPAPAPAAAPSSEADWADAAAAWAASGFAADKMPVFVRHRQSEPPPAEPAAPVETREAMPTPAAVVPELPLDAFSPTLPPASPPPAVSAPSISPTPPFLAAAPSPTPPPLKPPSRPEIVLPSPGVPPPLGGRAASTYVMKGSGEGQSGEDAPWIGDRAREAESKPQPVRMVLPSIPPSPAETVEAEPAPAARGGHPVAWALLAIFLLGSGGFVAWWFFLGGQERFFPAEAPKTAPDAGAPAAVAEPTPATEEARATAPDAGEPSDAGTLETPPSVPPPAVEPPKPPPGPRAVGPRPLKPDRPVAAVDRKARAAEALESYKKGNEAVKKAQYNEALRHYQKALELDPTLAVAHRGLGICYAQLRRNQDACREYRIYQKSLPPNSKELPALQQILKDCK